ncbi:MLO-like protein 12 [Mercurialis annua]|uniref:MLO-like protein 12 n=1 Tax=Mercurialis annua TaxID=3986 RepID=UPI00215E5D9D|nr:MLO-like protein 12 [Mercurialis annua]
MGKGNATLELTPTWATSIICLCFILVSLLLEAALHHITEFFRKRKTKSLARAVKKIESEMITMGFISLLLTVSEAPITKICVNEAVANSFHPCRHNQPAAISAASKASDESYCQEKGMVSLISREGVMQLKMFISVLAVFHVICCTLTMFLGLAKMRKWKKWEEETRSLDYQMANDPRRFRLIRQTSFGRRHLKLWSDHSFLLWPVCFIRQFKGSASKADYFTLRNGFILANVAEGSEFNFQKFLAKAFDDDFQHVVGIRLWIWMFCLLFIFFSAQEFYNYYWLPFLTLVLVLAVGTKLETIITKMCKESSKQSSVIRGTFLVKPSNQLFWFNRPKFMLYLLQLIIVQNSFQLAFFSWAWYQYGLRSCFNQETADVVIRITTGVGVQFLCGYVTLPIYALVTQMGSSSKNAVFTERVRKGLKNWHWKATHNNNSSSSGTNSTFTPLLDIMGSSSSPESRKENSVRAREIISNSTPEKTSSRVSARGNECDDEISFASSWKIFESTRVSGEIRSIIEEEEYEDEDYSKYSY